MKEGQVHIHPAVFFNVSSPDIISSLDPGLLQEKMFSRCSGFDKHGNEQNREWLHSIYSESLMG